MDAPKKNRRICVGGKRPSGLRLVSAAGMREHRLGTGRFQRREEPRPALRNVAQTTAPGNPSLASLLTGSEQQSRCLCGRLAAPDICPEGGEWWSQIGQSPQRAGPAISWPCQDESNYGGNGARPL